ncbi:MAG: dienelactone hydrolase family protein [Opitutia bacterium]
MPRPAVWFLPAAVLLLLSGCASPVREPDPWAAALGSPSGEVWQPSLRLIETFRTPEYEGRLYRQRTGPSTEQLVLLMVPPGLRGRAPGVVVPFYDPDRMCGHDLRTKSPLGPERNSAKFGLHLVRQGYVVAAAESYPYNLLTAEESPKDRSGFGVWRAAAAKLARTDPQWTGMGKLAHDARRAMDLLAESPEVDPARLAYMGHSLGGKTSFYAGCLDPRARAVVASDFGIAWDSTNWGDPWYFGAKLAGMRASGLEHGDLLARMAPRGFFLIAGQYDGSRSRPQLDLAAEAYRRAGADDQALRMFDHASGHQPSYDSLRAAYRWLAARLDRPAPDLAFLDELERRQAAAPKR